MLKHFLEYFQAKDPEEQQYFLEFAVYGLTRHGHQDRADELLVNFEFIDTKLRTFGIDQLLEDYKHTTAVDPLLVLEALTLASRALRQDPSQLYIQLYGRLLGREVLERLKPPHPYCWLRSVSPSLIPAGGGILLNVLTEIGSRTIITSRATTALSVSQRSDSFSITSLSLDNGQILSRFTIPLVAPLFRLELVPSESGATVALVVSDELQTEVILVSVDRRRLIGRFYVSPVAKIMLYPDIDRAVFLTSTLSLCIVELHTGRKQLSVALPFKPVVFFMPPDGKIILVGFAESILGVVDTDSGKLRITLRIPSTEAPIAVATDATGRYAAAILGDGTLIAYDLTNEKLLDTYSGGDIVPSELTVKLRHGSSTSIDGLLHDELVIIATVGRDVLTWVLSLSAGAAAEKSTASNNAAGLNSPRRRFQLLRTRVVKALEKARLVKADESVASRQPTLRSSGSFSHANRLVGHADTINAVIVSDDLSTLVSASKDGTLKHWDLNTGLLLHTLRGHTGEVSSVRLTADGRTVVSAGADNTIKVWTLTRGGGDLLLTERQSRKAPMADFWDVGWQDYVFSESYLCDLQVTPDSRRVIGISKDGTVAIFSLFDYRELARLCPATEHGTGWAKRQRATAEFYEEFSLRRYFSPRLRVTADCMRAYVRTRDGRLIGWNIWSGLTEPTPVEEIIEPIYSIRDFALHPDNIHISYVTDDRLTHYFDRQSGVTGHKPSFLLRSVKACVSLAMMGCRVPYALLADPAFLLSALIATWLGRHHTNDTLWSLPVFAVVLALMGDDGMVCRKFKVKTVLVFLGQEPPNVRLLQAIRTVYARFTAMPINAGPPSASKTISRMAKVVARTLLFPLVLPLKLSPYVPTDPSEISSVLLFSSDRDAHDEIRKIVRSPSIAVRVYNVFVLLFGWSGGLLCVFRWLARDLAILGRKRPEFVVACGAIGAAWLGVYLDTSAVLAVAATVTVFVMVPDVLLAFFTRVEESGDGRYVIIQSFAKGDYVSDLIDTATGLRLRRFPGKCWFVSQQRLIQINRAGSFLRDIETGHLENQCQHHASPDAVIGVTVGEDGERFLVHELERIEIIDAQGKSIAGITGRYDSPVFALHDLYLMVISPVDHTVKVISLEDRRIVTSFTPDVRPTCCTITPDGRTVLVGDSEGGVHFLELMISEVVTTHKK